MEPAEQPTEQAAPAARQNRPVLLTVLCLGSLVFFGLLTALFLAGVIWNEKIAAVTARYHLSGPGSIPGTFGFFLTAFLLHTLAFAGIILIFRLRKAGYYLLGTACLAIAGYQLFNPSGTVVSTVIYILFILSFGIFFRRLH
jgi:hypothetical protein